MLLSNSSLLLMVWTDTIILGIFRTEGEIGIYNVAFRVAFLTSFTLSAIFSITTPKIAGLHGLGDTKELKRVFQISTKMVFWTSIPVLLTIFLFPSFILGIFGSAFKDGVYALLILSFGYFLASIFGSAGQLLQMTGKHKLHLYIVLSATIINIILNIALVPVYGINGAALSTLVSLSLASLAMVIFVYKLFGFTTIYFPLMKSSS
jgi:O-antigen/teichoic acid export membrane protein